MKRGMKVVFQWVFGAIAVLAVGPIAGWAVSAHRGVDGSVHATMLVGANPMVGVLGHAGAIVLAAALGLVTARVINGRFGLFATGAVLAWGAARSGRIEAVLGVQPTNSTLTTLAIEGALLAAAAGAVAWLICRDTEHEDPAKHEKALSAETLLGMTAALVAGGIGAWLAARDDLKGQTIGAAWVAGALGATLARVLAHRAPGWAVVAGVCLCAVVGPILGLMAGAVPALAGMYNGSISSSLASLARVAPLDWLAGAFMGVPVGMSWAGSMVDKRVEESEAVSKPSGA